MSSPSMSYIRLIAHFLRGTSSIISSSTPIEYLRRNTTDGKTYYGNSVIVKNNCLP